jgi:peptide chain release factor 3
VAELAPPPLPRVDIAEVERPLVSPFAGFVFKIQANMDPNHRDRLAFARVCSGHFERGMDIECARSGRAVGTKYVTTAFGNDRETIEEAFPGDIIGLVNAGDLRIGDTIYAGKKVEFPGVPRFAPEVFASARPLDRSKIKQFRKGIEQLDQEGVVQVLRDLDFGDTEPVLAAVGVLQFEVFAYRLSSEFSAPTEIISSPYQAMRITDKASADRLRQIGGIRILYRSDNEMVALFENKYRLQRLEKDEPELTLKLVFDGQPDS